MIKVSYSCSVITSHNWIIVQPTSNNQGCNYRNRAECPLVTKCLGLLLGGWKLREVILTIQTFFKVKNNFL